MADFHVACPHCACTYTHTCIRLAVVTWQMQWLSSSARKTIRDMLERDVHWTSTWHMHIPRFLGLHYVRSSYQLRPQLHPAMPPPPALTVKLQLHPCNPLQFQPMRTQLHPCHPLQFQLLRTHMPRGPGSTRRWKRYVSMMTRRWMRYFSVISVDV